MTFFLSYGADILIIIASLGAMGYCMVLSRRLSRLTSFDKGLGGAIAVMSSQVDEMKSALKEAKSGSDGAGNQLNELIHQAKEISSELEMMIAACHDFAEDAISVQAPRQSSIDQPFVLPDGEDSPETAKPEQIQEVTTPMFGSRRNSIDREPDAGPTIEPLFGRRKSAVS